MDVQGLENEAQSAIASASTLAELDDARVRYLGRKSALKQALREVRDPESGRVLNTLREQLEREVAEREAALSGQDLERRLSEEQVDVTLPGRATPRGQLHLVTQVRREVEDVFLGLGYRVVDGREVETTHYNFDALNLPTTHPARSQLQSLFLNRGRRPANRDLAVPDPRHGGGRAARLHDLDRPGVPARDPRRDPLARSSTRSRALPSTAGSRWPTSRARCST